MFTVGGYGREIYGHTLGNSIFSHFNDCSYIAVTESAVPGFNIGDAGIERSGEVGGSFDVANRGRDHCKAIKFLFIREDTPDDRCVASVGDPANFRVEISDVVTPLVQGSDGDKAN